MGWVKLEDNFFSHPKMLAAGIDAVGLYVCALAYANQHLTDGHIPAGWVKQMVGAPTGKRLAGRLVDVGLWTEGKNGWEVHSYLEHQRSREEVEQAKAEKSAAGKKGAKARWATA